MNTPIETIELPKQEGFSLTLKAYPEYESIKDLFPDDDNEEIQAKINSGEFMYFCASVETSKKNIVLGEDSLGGCVHTNLQDFKDNGGYLEDMIKTAIVHAKETLKELIK